MQLDQLTSVCNSLGRYSLCGTASVGCSPTWGAVPPTGFPDFRGTASACCSKPWDGTASACCSIGLWKTTSAGCPPGGMEVQHPTQAPQVLMKQPALAVSQPEDLRRQPSLAINHSEAQLPLAQGQPPVLPLGRQETVLQPPSVLPVLAVTLDEQRYPIGMDTKAVPVTTSVQCLETC